MSAKLSFTFKHINFPLFPLLTHSALLDRFYTLLADYGKDSVDKLDQREKQLIEMQKRQQAELMR